MLKSRSRQLRWASPFAVLALGAPAPAAGQITLSALTTVRSTDAGTYLSIDTHYAVGADGTVYAAPTHDPGTVAVFAPNGAFVRRIGSLGQGPGELSDAFTVALSPSGELHVFEYRSHRVSVFTAEGAFLRTYRLPLSLGPGYYAFGRTLRFAPSGALALHLGGQEGSAVLFVAGDGALERRQDLERGGFFDPTPDGGIWVAPRMNPDTAVLHRVGADGTLTATISLAVPEEVRAQARGVPRFLDVALGPDGVLWVAATVEKADSPPLAPPPPAAGGEPRPVQIPRDIPSLRARRLDLIYAIDPRNGAVLASRAFDDLYIAHFLPGGLVASLDGDEFELVHATILRMTLER